MYNKLDVNKLKTVSKHYGDQDHIYENIPQHRVRYLDAHRVNSWRWQAHDGGWNFRNRKAQSPGVGTKIEKDVSILVFHGNPKPHEVNDTIIKQHWK